MEAVSDRQLVGYHCESKQAEVFEPDNELPWTQFLLGVDARILTSQPALHSEDDDDYDSLPVEETYFDELELDLLMDEDKSRAALAEALVSSLHVPPQICDSVVDKIVQDFRVAETDSRPFSDRMLVHMPVSIVVLVDEFGGLDTDDPKFVPASKSSIEKLERVRVEVSADCSICMEEMEVGSEAIPMPCSRSHLYHDDCIIEWLKKSRVCPLCRFAMPPEITTQN
ncbi:E3 ubiquitin ligase BIG BROTHER-related-like [Pyrus ussuriensis x Pyrus communis]|uniref:RING-type E3 ubiquitin transferase n=1 Tax=Pyrus ussuriensis x Pyrus communis TaxID=2448454 RepID=A0A5N5EWE8_9ROSA|nr:E3 ubiquitin ligase BIG BROTHER-related-like [Pyrus ussuriensis x Pyrus communis]